MEDWEEVPPVTCEDIQLRLLTYAVLHVIVKHDIFFLTVYYLHKAFMGNTYLTSHFCGSNMRVSFL